MLFAFLLNVKFIHVIVVGDALHHHIGLTALLTVQTCLVV